jgi:alpha-glucosidase
VTGAPIGQEWWRGGVLYNAYPRSWQDSDGDGIGDLRGIVARLDHLEWLGVDGLWLNPITPSPNRDWGYDVSDYCGVHPDFGDLDDVDLLISEARRRGIAVILDIVPSHTSNEHEWFVDARRSRTSRHRDYYVWAPGTADGAPPNNWLSYFGGPAWTRDDATGDYYMHNFSPYQPQLNWWNPDVAAEFDRVFRWWFDRGVGGMRIDALQALVHDRLLRDNPPATRTGTSTEQKLGQQFVFNANRPETHGMVRRWRAVAGEYGPPRLLFGETWVPSLRQLASYYGNGSDELHLAWNLPFLTAPWRAADLRAVIEEMLALIPPGAGAAWAMSSHDGPGRGPTRWCGNDPDAIRCALMLLLGLPGTPVLYYGDEIGMPNAPAGVLPAESRDNVDDVARDAARTPMQWTDGPGAGFTSATTPWLPLGTASTANVAAQRDDPASVLRLCRDLIQLRRRVPALSSGAATLVPAPPGVLAWRRGDDTVVAINVGGDAALLPGTGRIAICTDRARDGEPVDGALVLPPNRGAVVLDLP